MTDATRTEVAILAEMIRPDLSVTGEGPIGSHGFRSGAFGVRRTGGAIFTVTTSVPHKFTSERQNDMILTRAAYVLAARELAAAKK